MFQSATIRSTILILTSASLVACGASPTPEESETAQTEQEVQGSSTDGDEENPADCSNTDTPPSEQETDTTEDNSDDAAPEPLSFSGTFIDGWGGEHTIGQDSWVSGSSVFHVATWSNQEQYIVAQNDTDNEWNPDLWSRFDWVTVESQLCYCQTTYDAPTLDDALAAGADDSDPATTGCGGFAWSTLHEALNLRGTYTDNYGGDHAISQESWVMGDATFHIAQFSNSEGFLVAQNDTANEWNPGLWSRFDWTTVAGITYYCQTAYDASSEETALGTPAASADNPAETGCGGWSWSHFTTSEG